MPELVLLLVLIALAGCYSKPATSPATTVGTNAHPEADRELVLELLQYAINNRLSLMPDVARAKFEQQLAVTDREREERLVEAFCLRAADLNVSAEVAEKILRGQIAAATTVQAELMATWAHQPPGPEWPVRHLVQELRPLIDAQNDMLLIAVAEMGRMSAEDRTAMLRRIQDDAVLPPHVSQTAWDQALAAFEGLPAQFRIDPTKHNPFLRSRQGLPHPLERVPLPVLLMPEPKESEAETP